MITMMKCLHGAEDIIRGNGVGVRCACNEWKRKWAAAVKV